ncbi:MAG: type II toxin-antitoxin system HicA family toxin [Planctomycetota bacterium]|nr:type II toxin-antitoxin system HicA family toxin [Planctomycetota bacterium]
MMPRLPVLSGAEAAKAFERGGWRVDRQRGSHAIMLKAGHIASLSVPQHRELAPGTLRSLIRAAGMTVEEFAALC